MPPIGAVFRGSDWNQRLSGQFSRRALHHPVQVDPRSPTPETTGRGRCAPQQGLSMVEKGCGRPRLRSHSSRRDCREGVGSSFGNRCPCKPTISGVTVGVGFCLQQTGKAGRKELPRQAARASCNEYAVALSRFQAKCRKKEL